MKSLLKNGSMILLVIFFFIATTGWTGDKEEKFVDWMDIFNMSMLATFVGFFVLMAAFDWASSRLKRRSRKKGF